MSMLTRQATIDIMRSSAQLQASIFEKYGVKVFVRVKVHHGTIEEHLQELFEKMLICWGGQMSLNDFQRKCRKRELVIMKKIMMMAAKFKYPKASYRVIGSFFYKMDHTSVMHNETTGYELLSIQDSIFCTYYEPVKHFFDEAEADQ